jgi:hypothetical protein
MSILLTDPKVISSRKWDLEEFDASHLRWVRALWVHLIGGAAPIRSAMGAPYGCRVPDGVHLRVVQLGAGCLKGCA